MSKISNEELIKALRDCAATWNTIDDCDAEECPFTGYGSMCLDTMLEAAADAIESKSKTVIPHRNYENLSLYWCDCGWFLRNKDKTPNYCPNCGKRIEWENAE